MRRVVIPFIAAALLSGATPAFAQTAPSAAVTAPSDGMVVEGTVMVRGRGSATTGVRSLKLFIEGTLVASKEPTELRQDVEVEYSWDTTKVLGTPGIARNGWYQIKTVVVANGGGSTDATRNVRVNNPAAAPTGLSVLVTERQVSLSWDANPEPDIQGYRVESDEGSGFTTIGQTASTDFAYEAAPGSYTWRVIALRASPLDPEGRPSLPSATVAKTIAAPASADGKRSGGKGDVVGNKKLFGGATTKEARKSLRQTARHFATGTISSAAISLPGTAVGLPNLPDTELEWGTYKEKLPYNLPATKGLSLETAPVRLAAHSSTHVMPLDALRWVAAGLLLMVTAGLLQLLALRAQKREQTV